MVAAAAQDGIDRQKLCLDVETLEARCVKLGDTLTLSEQSVTAQDVDHCEKVQAMEEELQRCKVKYEKLEE